MPISIDKHTKKGLSIKPHIRLKTDARDHSRLIDTFL